MALNDKDREALRGTIKKSQKSLLDGMMKGGAEFGKGFVDDIATGLKLILVLWVVLALAISMHIVG